MWLICIRRLNELRTILYGPKKKVNSFDSALCLQKKCDLVKFINDVMITWIPHKNDAKSKSFCPTRRTHTHTQTLQDESKARKWIICQRIGKLKVNNGMQTNLAKPSRVKLNKSKMSKNLINVVLATYYSSMLYMFDNQENT